MCLGCGRGDSAAVVCGECALLVPSALLVLASDALDLHADATYETAVRCVGLWFSIHPVEPAIDEPGAA